MPGCGKSTVGVLLAKLCGKRFVDTDLDIQQREGATLQAILETHGHHYLRDVEQAVLLDIALDDAVIATGGSVVYSRAGMTRLAAAGPRVYIDTHLAALQARVAAGPARGIASPPDQTLAEVYAERTPLYRQYADLTIDPGTLSPDALARDILDRLG